MKKGLTMGLSAAVLLALAGCSSVAHIEKDPAANLGSYRTFSWVETRDTAAAEGARKVITLNEQTIRAAVDQELKEVGWKEAKSKPDVLISYDVLVENTVKESVRPVYSRSGMRYYFNPLSRRWVGFYNPGQFLGYDRDEYGTKEGTVTITMVDAATDKVIWQGWTVEEVNNKNLTAKELQNSIRAIFRKFDVARN